VTSNGTLARLFGANGPLAGRVCKTAGRKWEGNLSRSRCDWFDVVAVRSAIEQGSISERAAYLEYASAAGRPYARSTFSVMLRRKAEPKAAPSEPLTCAEITERWRERSAVKPRILTLSPGGGLRVQAGALIAFDGATKLTYSKAAKPPSAIVLSSAGGFVSIEAVRFCARASVAIVALDRAQGLISIMGAGGAANARLIRAQVNASPLPIARTIVGAKIEAAAHVGALADPAPYMAALAPAKNLDRVRIIEAQAARISWPDPPLMKWTKGSIPPDWKSPWLMRSRIDASGRPKRGARHPVNAMLNVAFSVTAGRLAAYLAAAGFAPAIGFLHADKRGRFSLAWDAIEPLRPLIEARLFRFIEVERFAVSDFVRAADGSIRLAPGLLGVVLEHCAPPHATLANTVRWIERLVLSAVESEGASGDEKSLRKAGRLGVALGGGGFERGDLPRIGIDLSGERL
jgi:CRISPR/Cas system-associated endonuclease Cas1